MQKTYVLDTNVLIQSPRALLSFEDNRIVLPIAVLEELDALKTSDGERGANARACIRYLEGLRLEGSLTEGVPLPGGGSLRLEINCVDVPLPEGFPEHKNDSRILKVCLGIRAKEAPVILVTKDIVVRIKARCWALRQRIIGWSRRRRATSSTQAAPRCMWRRRFLSSFLSAR